MSDEEEEQQYEQEQEQETSYSVGAQPSYAYLLDKDKERLCRKDLAYCTRDQKGNPIPFCFEYPDDEKCDRNTIPPNILFMGCYDDPTCGGKPLGPTTVKKSAAPQVQAQAQAQPQKVITIVKKKKKEKPGTVPIVLLVVLVLVLIAVLVFLYRRYYGRRRRTPR